jgi:predicted helicase
MIDAYLKEIAAITKRGDATENSYYSALKDFIEGFSKERRKKTLHVTVLPKKTEAGNPDFRIWDGKHSQVGYVEAKQPSTNLDDVETGDQLKRYISTFPNVILTNFYEFRLYQHGKRVDRVLLARPFIAAKLGAVPPAEHPKEFSALLEQFLQFSLPSKFTAETLAKELATRTRFLRDQVISEELREASSPSGKKILGFYQAFQKHLIANLKPDDFADLYAQTITYGLFAARTRSTNGFSRQLAYDFIPKTIGILREIFHFISFDPPEQLAVTVDDIAEVLAVADVNKILHEFFEKGKGSDPIYHFYETFLAAYDPEQRERRGVYYTPEPVVSYIVRSLNIILKERFGKADGFAMDSVTVLDPAAGTLTFLAEAAKLAVEEYVSKYGEGSRRQFIEDHILKHFYAFELMMAPYAAGHLKMGFLLEELGHKLTGDERFQFYLTNTLEMEELAQTSMPGMSSLSEESRLAGEIKKHHPILVILGNPPYSGHSTNKGEWITEQIENYKTVDGKPLGEKNPKWLQDDYVKFIRFAQWKIDQIGYGVLGFITNHSYLDNPTFRGMRQSLIESFDEIYILDLHGNSLKKEKAPDGSKDENVFDIQQGVAIALFVKHEEKQKRTTIRFSERWGVQEKKYAWLLSHDVHSTKWQTLTPRSPGYFFIPRDERLSVRYEQYPSVQQLFPVNSVGIVTARDNLTIRWTEKDVLNTVRNFESLDPEIARAAYKLGEDARDWKVKLAQEDLRKSGSSKENILPILYRVFDKRFTYYTGHSKGFHCMPRGEVMRHMLQPNLALILPKRVETQIPWTHSFVSDSLVEHVAVSLKTIDYCMPLYLYTEQIKPRRGIGMTMMLFEPAGGYGAKRKIPNLAPQILESLANSFHKQPTPEEIFNYIYGILYVNAYRKKYAEFLKSDFPRVPFTADKKVFQSLAQKGEQLVALHLLKSKSLDTPGASFKGKGDNRIEELLYNAKQRRVAINQDQYFTGVEEEVWEYRIGGYQVAEKWLKDRKGRILSAEDVRHYCRLIASLAETIEIQSTLDPLFLKVEQTVLEITLGKG